MDSTLKSIPFNIPYQSGNELEYIKQAIDSGKISGNGMFTQKCQEWFESTYNCKKGLMTTSCTDALEMCAILAELGPGDEVIMPSFTFVSTALPFLRVGASIKFCDSLSDNPNIDENKIEALINNNTKAIVVVHYAGVSCNMDKIMDLASKYNLLVIEDAAQAIDSKYISPKGDSSTNHGKQLGTVGHMGAFSFHETKNIMCGEGGLLLINDDRFVNRAEIVWEKGTNRAEFFRGQVNKYGWKDIGSSFLPSELNSAFLFAQLENMNTIQSKRKDLWKAYNEVLLENGLFKKPPTPTSGEINGHMYYLVCNSLAGRTKIIDTLKLNNIFPAFHYQSLHVSEYFKEKHNGDELALSDMYSDCLLRLPLYYELSIEDVNRIGKIINEIR
jgi:dTDP-4-amino-4,6-dideoxygalactose transaminase